MLSMSDRARLVLFYSARCLHRPRRDHLFFYQYPNRGGLGRNTCGGPQHRHQGSSLATSLLSTSQGIATVDRLKIDRLQRV